MQPACTYFRMSAVVRLLFQESHPLVSGAATLRGNLGEYQAHSAVTKHTDVGLAAINAWSPNRDKEVGYGACTRKASG